MLVLEKLPAREPKDTGGRSGLLVVSEGSAVAPRTLTENWDIQELFVPPAPPPLSSVPARNNTLKVQPSSEFLPREHYWYCTVPVSS